MNLRFGTIPLASLALAAVSVLPLSGVSQAAAAKNISDAQLEANVLRAFASDNRLASQAINTSTVFGTVTLSGSVDTETARTAAEDVASHITGVKKVVDQLAVGAAQPAADGSGGAAQAGVSMSAAQAGAIVARRSGQPDPDGGNLAPDSDMQPAQAQAGQPDNFPPQQPYQRRFPGAPEYGQQGPVAQRGAGAPQYDDPDFSDLDPEANYPQPAPQQRRLYRRDYERQMASGGYNQAQGQGYPQDGYAQRNDYPQYPQQGGYPPRRGSAQRNGLERPGQAPGRQVSLPAGSVLAVSINNWLSSGDAAPGFSFTGLVQSDLIADGAIAVPRGATVEGTVVSARGAGALKGRGSLTLQLVSLEMGGQRYPLQSEPFTVNGHDKTAASVNSTLIGAGVGALLGAAVGGGTGAAIGAGVGGGAGLGAAAASGRGQVNIAPESLLRFRLTAPLQVATVSESEMQRLGGYAGPATSYRSGPPRYARPYPTVGIYAAPYPYSYRRGYRPGYWY